MKLDEVIQHFRGTARGLRNREETLEAMGQDGTDCAECAAEHEQFAEWLTELKQRRGQEKHGRWENGECTNCKRNLLELCGGEDYELAMYAEFDADFCPFCGAIMDTTDICEDCGAEKCD